MRHLNVVYLFFHCREKHEKNHQPQLHQVKTIAKPTIVKETLDTHAWILLYTPGRKIEELTVGKSAIHSRALCYTFTSNYVTLIFRPLQTNL